MVAGAGQPWGNKDQDRQTGSVVFPAFPGFVHLPNPRSESASTRTGMMGTGTDTQSHAHVL